MVLIYYEHFSKDDNNSSFTLKEELSNISAIVAIIELNFDQKPVNTFKKIEDL